MVKKCSSPIVTLYSIDKQYLYKKNIMKLLSYVAVLASVIGISASIYCQIEYVPKLSHSMIDIFGPRLYYSYSETALIFGYIALFAGGLGLVIGIIAGVKKQIGGWIAAVIGLISFIFGLFQATQLFN